MDDRGKGSGCAGARTRPSRPADDRMSVSADWSWQRVALAGARDALSLPAWIVGFGLVGIGSLAHDVGYPVGSAVLSTILVWAGPSQVLFFASIAAGAAWSAIAIAIAFAALVLSELITRRFGRRILGR